MISHPDPPPSKINKEVSELNDQMDLIATYRIFYPIAAEYTFFSEAHGTSSKIDHISYLRT
jgi:hypothetical protein